MHENDLCCRQCNLPMMVSITTINEILTLVKLIEKVIKFVEDRGSGVGSASISLSILSLRIN